MLKKVISSIIVVALLLVLFVNSVIVIDSYANPNEIPSFFGWKPFIVLSGSMESEIFPGDLAIVMEVDSSRLKVNDIIAFKDSENLVTTHRIINVFETGNDLYFETKGDNNNTKDESLVSAKNVEGMYKFKIPKIGNIVLFIQQPVGFAIMMMSIFIVCMFIYLFENRKINKQIAIENEAEMKEFEEYKKAKEKAKLEQKTK